MAGPVRLALEHGEATVFFVDRIQEVAKLHGLAHVQPTRFGDDQKRVGMRSERSDVRGAERGRGVNDDEVVGHRDVIVEGP